MENEIANIALYLNCALRLIRANHNSPHYLTGVTGGPTLTLPGTQNQETQCMMVGGALWIANNDDADSATQRELLNHLGINRLNKLVDHVERYRGRVLPTHNGAYNPHTFTLKQALLFALMPASERTTPPAAHDGRFPNNVNNIAFTLGNPVTNLKNCSRIVFVSGSYTGQGGTSLHAEQKLLAALGELWQDWSYRQPVYIQGCKPPCTRCAQVLRGVNQRLSSGKRFSYANTTVADARTTVALNQVTTNGSVRALDLDQYFPAAEDG